GKVRDGEEHVGAEVGIDDGAEGELHFLDGESQRLLAFLAAQGWIVAAGEQERPALVTALGVEDGADVGVERLRPAQQRHLRRSATRRGGGGLRPRLRRLAGGSGRGVLAQGLLQLAAERLVVLPSVGRSGLRRRGTAIRRRGDASVPL